MITEVGGAAIGVCQYFSIQMSSETVHIVLLKFIQFETFEIRYWELKDKF